MGHSDQLKTIGKFSEQARIQLRETLTRIYQPEPDSDWLNDLLVQLDNVGTTQSAVCAPAVQLSDEQTS